jgi:thioredoxin-related protein
LLLQIAKKLHKKSKSVILYFYKFINCPGDLKKKKGVLSMKKVAFIIVAIALSRLYSLADIEWLSDFKKASEIAKEKQLPILANFTGSDWCPWCMKLQKEVFSTKEFQSWANTNVVLLVVDFPRFKKLPEEKSKLNEELAKKYGILGFPTILLLNHEGKVIGETGYKPGGASAYIEHLKQLLEKQEKKSHSVQK